MVEKWTREKFEEVRNSTSGESVLPFLYLSYREGGRVEIEIEDDTFTQVFEGETGLDGREANWDQTQITVFDENDYGRKVFKLNEHLASLMWRKAEDNNLDPLNMTGIVFNIERESHNYYIEIEQQKKETKEDQETPASTEDVKEIVLDVVEENPDMDLKGIFLWSKEHLKETNKSVDDTTLKQIISDLVNKSYIKEERKLNE